MCGSCLTFCPRPYTGLLPLSPGTGEPILLIPGFLAGDWTLRVMAGWLNRLGYQSYLSGIDWNVDCPNRTGELLGWRVDHILQETGQPLTVIGHSLGGMLARFLGATYPTKISSVIAIGSPLSPPVKVNPIVLVASHVLYPIRRVRGRVPAECGSLECSCQFQQTTFGPFPSRVHFASIFSKDDEIVAWHSSVDPEGQNLEVPGKTPGADCESLCLSGPAPGPGRGGRRIRWHRGTARCQRTGGRRRQHGLRTTASLARPISD